MESAWQKSQDAIAASNAAAIAPGRSALLSYYKLKMATAKNHAMAAAQEQFLETTIETRCEQLQNEPEAELAQRYLRLATTAYDAACQDYCQQLDSGIRGTHIHQIAENLAKIDRERSEQCLMGRYPFDGIEQCYYLGQLAGIFSPCGAKPDLINTETGNIYDFKTGVAGTNRERHLKNLKHVPTPETGVVSNYDVRVDRVEPKYSSKVPRYRPSPANQ